MGNAPGFGMILITQVHPFIKPQDGTLYVLNFMYISLQRRNMLTQVISMYRDMFGGTGYNELCGFGMRRARWVARD